MSGKQRTSSAAARAIMTFMTNPAPKPRWYRLTPDRFVIILLVVECLLWLSERFQWFAFNEKKGWTVIIAVAVVGAGFLLMLLWLVASLLFRWRFQFSIRSLLTLAVVVAIPCSWMMVETQRARTQHDAVAVYVRESGQGVIYDFQMNPPGRSRLPGGPIDEFESTMGLAWHMSSPPEKPHAPGWLMDLLGDDFFCDVIVAQPRNDTQLFLLQPLKTLRRLEFSDSGVTDTGMATLKELRQLQWLNLRRAKVTDAGVKYLQGLSQIRVLDLGGTQVTNDGLIYLKDLRQLQRLDLGFTTVADAGLVNLQGLEQLRQLEFWGNKITDAGLEHLKALKHLESLTLAFANVTDGGFSKLKDMTHLQTLYLRGTKVTDAGISQLECFTQLQMVDLHSTQVTDAGVKKLQQALPNCKIER